MLNLPQRMGMELGTKLSVNKGKTSNTLRVTSSEQRLGQGTKAESRVWVTSQPPQVGLRWNPELVSRD
jgi:hypothetical protein